MSELYGVANGTDTSRTLSPGNLIGPVDYLPQRRYSSLGRMIVAIYNLRRVSQSRLLDDVGDGNGYVSAPSNSSHAHSNYRITAKLHKMAITVLYYRFPLRVV